VSPDTGEPGTDDVNANVCPALLIVTVCAVDDTAR